MKRTVVVSIICLSLLVSGYVVNFKIAGHAATEEVKNKKLGVALSSIPDWKAGRDIPLLDVIVEELKLDDYINRDYHKEDDSVILYIGYYYTSKKAGAAHDPMVCFPGQGWEVSGNTKDSDPIGKLGQPLNYSSMTVELGEVRYLIVYWFQAYDKTTASTFMQKVHLARKKLFGRGEENAFVRVSVPCNEDGINNCKKVAFDFIDSFYPSFEAFVTSDTP